MKNVLSPLYIAISIICFIGVSCSQESTDVRDDSNVATELPKQIDSVMADKDEDEVPQKTGNTTEISGGTLVRIWSDPPTLDPHLTTDSTSATVIVELFGGLVTLDKDLNIVPDVANWNLDGPGTTYTFNISEDAQFHNGKPVLASDVKWSLERAADPNTGAPIVQEYLGDIVGVTEKLNGKSDTISGIRVLDKRTIEVKIDSAKPYFLAKLTYPTAFILDEENVNSSPTRWFRQPNGTGPFKLTQYIPGEVLIMSRHENYHLGPAHLDSVKFILSGGASMLMYENDEIHITGVGPADLDRILDTTNPLNDDLQRAPPSFSTQYIGLNNDEPPFDDINVRKALSYAIDKDIIAKDVLGNMVTPAQGILPPGFPGYTGDVGGHTYNPEMALEFLRKSKYGVDLGGHTVILTTAGGFGSSVDLDLEVILEMWRENLGVSVEIQQTEFATYLQDLVKRRFQMFEIGWAADYPDPENFLDILFHSQSHNNHTAYSNPEVDRLLVLARTEQNQSTRFDLYKQAERIIVDEAPWIPLWYSGEQYVLIKPHVHDYLLTPLLIPKHRFIYMSES